MKVVVKLYGLLRRYRPDTFTGKPHQPFELTVDAGTMITGLISQLGIDNGLVAGISVNGEAVNGDQVMNDSDEIGLFPPVAGG